MVPSRFGAREVSMHIYINDQMFLPLFAAFECISETNWLLLTLSPAFSDLRQPGLTLMDRGGR